MNYLVISAIVGIIFLGFSSANNAYATDIVLNSVSCPTLPGGGTAWDAPTSTCSKTSGSNMVIPATDTLTIPNGVTLEFATSRDLQTNGDVTNNGIINFSQGGDIFNQASATFTNSGIIELNSTQGGTGRLDNRNTATFINTITGTIMLDGPSGADGQIRNRNTADFTNAGTITIEGTSSHSGRLSNLDSANFTNSGTITMNGTNTHSGQIRNTGTASITNSGTITMDGTNNSSGQLRSTGTGSITNSGTITLTGINGASGRVTNLSVITNSGSLTTNNGFNNNNVNSEITNSGILQVTLNLNNIGGSIINICGGQITFGSISGNPIQEENCQISSGSSSNAYEDPTIGKSHHGRQVVENGICIDITCWTVTAAFHQDFELVEMFSDSIHTITTTVFCQNGVHRCNYVAFGVSPYGTNINDSVWKVILQKDHLDNWTMKVIDDEGYLGEVTSTTQIVDNRYLSASSTIEFKKPTPGMILNIEVRDSKGGYRDFKFNDGVAIVDSYAYPLIETSYDQPLEIEPLCLNENPDKRYTCAFAKVREQTLIDAAIAYEEIMSKK